MFAIRGESGKGRAYNLEYQILNFKLTHQRITVSKNEEIKLPYIDINESIYNGKNVYCSQDYEFFSVQHIIYPKNY